MRAWTKQPPPHCSAHQAAVHLPMPPPCPLHAGIHSLKLGILVIMYHFLWTRRATLRLPVAYATLCTSPSTRKRQRTCPPLHFPVTRSSYPHTAPQALTCAPCICCSRPAVPGAVPVAGLGRGLGVGWGQPPGRAPAAPGAGYLQANRSNNPRSSSSERYLSKCGQQHRHLPEPGELQRRAPAGRGGCLGCGLPYGHGGRGMYGSSWSYSCTAACRERGHAGQGLPRAQH